MEVRPEGRKSRERPRKPYRDGMEETARKNGTGVTELKKIAGDGETGGNGRGNSDVLRHKGWRKRKNIPNFDKL